MYVLKLVMMIEKCNTYLCPHFKVLFSNPSFFIKLEKKIHRIGKRYFGNAKTISIVIIC